MKTFLKQNWLFILIVAVLALTGIGWFLIKNNPSLKEKNDYNCSDFSSQQEAQRFFEEHGGINNDRYELDRDKDGRVCESLK
jgi:lipopolysaccharide export system protein LptC